MHRIKNEKHISTEIITLAREGEKACVDNPSKRLVRIPFETLEEGKVIVAAYVDSTSTGKGLRDGKLSATVISKNELIVIDDVFEDLCLEESDRKKLAIISTAESDELVGQIKKFIKKNSTNKSVQEKYKPYVQQLTDANTFTRVSQLSQNDQIDLNFEDGTLHIKTSKISHRKHQEKQPSQTKNNWASFFNIKPGILSMFPGFNLKRYP